MRAGGNLSSFCSPASTDERVGSLDVATVRAGGSSTRRRLPRIPGMAAVFLSPLFLAACVQQPPPAPAVISEAAPPWPAPKHAISYIDAAGLPQERLDTTTNRQTLQLSVKVAEQPVVVPAWIGVDRYRAVQAPVHTHTEDGEVWLEGKGAQDVTLGQFFTLWGVRMTNDCLGAVCGGVSASVDGQPFTGDPSDLLLSEVHARLDVSIE